MSDKKYVYDFLEKLNKKKMNLCENIILTNFCFIRIDLKFHVESGNGIKIDVFHLK